MHEWGRSIARLTFSLAAVIAVASGFGLDRTSRAGEPAAEARTGIAVLSDDTWLRTFYAFRTPIVIKADGSFTPAFIPRGKDKRDPIGDYQSPMPEAGWRGVEFDDVDWPRGRLPVEKDKGEASGRNPSALHTATPNSIICARAKFVVGDPARVGDLHLDLKYVGGVAVFLNGQEVLRQHLPEGELKPETLAEKYPDDLYVLPENKFQRLEEWDPKLFARRYRHVKDAVIPAKLLRKGTNVLALELHRAPVNEAATLATRDIYSGMYRMCGLWSYVALHGVRLTAPAGAAVQPNAGRPKGIQVWNCGLAETLALNSYGDPSAAPAPVRIDAARNGAFSGRLAVSSDDAIEDLKLSISPLAVAGGGPTLPSEAVQLRCGRRALAEESSRGEMLFDGLDGNIPARVDPAKVSVRREIKRGSKYEDITYQGAVLPVWITVRVPKDAKPGRYDGTVTVEAKGLEKTEVPVQCTVRGWTLADPVDFRVKQLPVFSPYSLALHYGVPFWSDRHFEMIAKSFSLMAEINARRVDVDLAVAVRTMHPFGMDHSTFRLVPKKDGEGYDYDFSNVEKLFDTIEKTMKSPLPLQVNCWGDTHSKDKGAWAAAGRVPVLDPATGKLGEIPNPPWGTEENFTFWKPILDDLRARIEKRGWLPVTAIGHQSYCWEPHPTQVDVALRIWPHFVYGWSSHAGLLNGVFKGTKQSVPVRYAECVWTAGRPEPRGYRRLLEPGRDQHIWDYSCRDQHRDNSPLKTFLDMPEMLILRNHDGLGYLCVDFLPIPHPSRKGQFYLLDSKVGNILGSSTRSLLAAGPEGPLATGRYEAFRLGVYRSEAVLYLQRGLDAKRIAGDLAKRASDCLDSRSRTILSGWDDQNGLWAADRELFGLAAEAEAAGWLPAAEKTPR